jgi:hypothetical protein
MGAMFHIGHQTHLHYALIGKSGKGNNMHVPAARERVRIVGQHGIYLVVSLDLDQKVADLIPLHGVANVEEDVSFSQLEAFRENKPLETA